MTTCQSTGEDAAFLIGELAGQHLEGGEELPADRRLLCTAPHARPPAKDRPLLPSEGPEGAARAARRRAALARGRRPGAWLSCTRPGKGGRCRQART
ncbi:MAG: hypothetical protein V2A73_01700 [Pseudomonadota bacterium]